MPPSRLSDENNPEDWFYSASDRLRAADSLHKTEGLTHSGVELLQEAAERYLKGFLVAHGWRLARTHDLRRLVQEAKVYDPSFSGFEAMSKELTEDFFAQHYPGGDWSNVGVHYDALREQLGKMVNHIQNDLPQYSTRPPTS